MKNKIKNRLFIDRHGNKYYYLNNKLHREDGPAIEYVDGHKEYYVNGELHRENGPAIVYANGDKSYYIKGRAHREDGPAVEWGDKKRSWYYNGEHIDVNSQKEFKRYLKLMVFR